jgi:hypothetical protein
MRKCVKSVIKINQLSLWLHILKGGIKIKSIIHLASHFKRCNKNKINYPFGFTFLKVE